MNRSGDERSRAILCGIAIAVLTTILTSLTLNDSFRRYNEFRTGWPWDLAYYNQWSWAMLFGDRTITVRPLSHYAAEGPSVWKMNYLSPLRFLVLAVYRFAPDPRTLLGIHGFVFWWIVPAAFTVVRAETRSNLVALSAASLVPLTPLLWPLAINDFREIRSRHPIRALGGSGRAFPKRLAECARDRGNARVSAGAGIRHRELRISTVARTRRF